MRSTKLTSANMMKNLNEAYVWNPIYKGKNYDPNYQNRNKTSHNNNNNSSSGTSGATREELPPNARPTTGEHAKSFNKFLPKKVEVSEATVDKVIGFDHFMRKSDAEVTEAIDLYKALR